MTCAHRKTSAAWMLAFPVLQPHAVAACRSSGPADDSEESAKDTGWAAVATMAPKAREADRAQRSELLFAGSGDRPPTLASRGSR